MTTSTTPRCNEATRLQYAQTGPSVCDKPDDQVHRFLALARTLERECAAQAAEIARLREALKESATSMEYALDVIDWENEVPPPCSVPVMLDGALEQARAALVQS